jgi:nitrous oxide reductase accessory protein NosL
MNYIYANDIKKGEKIYKILCDTKAVSTILYDTPEELEYQIKDKNYCSNINDKKLKSVVLYLTKKTQNEIKVPKDAKCPVCGMITSKYPKWIAIIKEGEKSLYFDGVKDMMKYYFNPEKFHHKKEDFTKIIVSDYYTLNPINAKNSWFVLGANIYGPMGNELIPFKTKEDAKEFLKEHFGKKIVKFSEITENLVYSLDN